jgi:hypothetical protein
MDIYRNYKAMNNRKINLRREVNALEYKNRPKTKKNIISVSLKLSGHYVDLIEHIAKRYNVTVNIFCKNLVLAYLEREEDKYGS